MTRPNRTPAEVEREMKGNWYTSDLYALIAKADHSNREKLRLAYPQEVAEWEGWFYSHPVNYDDGIHMGEDAYLEAEYEDRNGHPDDPSLEDETFNHADPSNY